MTDVSIEHQIEVIKKSGYFDAFYYLHQYRDLAGTRMDPVGHYCKYGWREYRNPSRRFNTRFYLHQHRDVAAARINPLFHYILFGAKEGRKLYAEASPAVHDVKLLAFYLPQFHPIKENDAWWGKGFTEWVNVKKGVPQFQGHYQPHLPGELDYYDLRDPKVMEGQVELAKLYGVHGFCFYYYWFNGRRVLEKPVDQFINSKLDLPFCLCWANENWTRKWDGGNHEILLAQNYEPGSLDRFIADIERYFKDERYIRIGGKPLFIIYRPSMIPGIKKAVARWRQYAKGKGIGDLYILGVYVKRWGFANHKAIGLDGMLEFPPLSMIESGAELMNRQISKFHDFNGNVYDYKNYVATKKYFTESVKALHRGICPNWDNTARRGKSSYIFHGSTPGLYKAWLMDLIRHTQKTFAKEKRMIFINAWNEWAEGAHLEPDRKHGYAYLEATKQALLETAHH